jgi:hypothetical protein
VTDKPEKVRFTFIAPEGYAPVYVSGAFGGVTPRGELVVSFYQERQPAPKPEVFNVLPDGRLGPPAEARTQPTFEIERHIVAGVIMNEQTTRELHIWLTQKLEELRLQREMQGRAEAGPAH